MPKNEQAGTARKVSIAKYRDHERPGKWYLTDFTMEQVEGRLNYLEQENVRLRDQSALAPAKSNEAGRPLDEDGNLNRWDKMKYEYVMGQLHAIEREADYAMMLTIEYVHALHDALSRKQAEVERLKYDMEIAKELYPYIWDRVALRKQMKKEPT